MKGPIPEGIWERLGPWAGRPCFPRLLARPPTRCAHRSTHARGFEQPSRHACLSKAPGPGGSRLVVSVVSSSSPLFPGVSLRGGAGATRTQFPRPAAPQKPWLGPQQRGRPWGPCSLRLACSFLGPSALGSARFSNAQRCSPGSDAPGSGLLQSSTQGLGVSTPANPEALCQREPCRCLCLTSLYWTWGRGDARPRSDPAWSLDRWACLGRQSSKSGPWGGQECRGFPRGHCRICPGLYPAAGGSWAPGNELTVFTGALPECAVSTTFSEGFQSHWVRVRPTRE